MIPIPTGVRVWLATGHTDMRKGFASLSLQVQEVLRRDPLGGHLFCFRGRRGDLLKVIWHDGQGACLFTKKLERGRFVWPTPADGAVDLDRPARLPAVGHRLASSPGHVASDLGRLRFSLAGCAGRDSMGG
jgi:transposase